MNFMEHDWTVQMYHVFRKANGCANALAKRGNQQQDLLKIYDACPTFVYVLFVWDMENLETSKICPLKVIMPVNV